MGYAIIMNDVFCVCRYLHADNRVDKEQHRYEQTNVRQRLEWERN